MANDKATPEEIQVWNANRQREKKLNHRNQHGRMVELEIEKAAIDHKSYDLEPRSKDWNEFNVQFVDGSTKQFSFGETLDLVE